MFSVVIMKNMKNMKNQSLTYCSYKEIIILIFIVPWDVLGLILALGLE